MGRVLVILVIVVLVLVFIAFLGIFGRFPDEWEWIGIVFAGVGLAVATPSMFQMFWGRCVVEAEFVLIQENSTRALGVFFKNPPVGNRILGILGVSRETVQSLTVAIRIAEVGSNVFKVPIRQVRIFSDDDSWELGSNRIVLPPTYSVSASIIVARWDESQKKAIIPKTRLKQTLLLDAGCYRADIMILVDGKPRIVSRQFVVGENANDLIWASKNSPISDKKGSQT